MHTVCDDIKASEQSSDPYIVIMIGILQAREKL